jgi:hypothetical protein
MTPLTPRWWLRRNPDLVLVAAVEATVDERAAACPLHEAVGLFEGWRGELHEDDDRGLLLEMASSGSGVASWSRASDVELLRAVHGELEAGRLLLVRAAVAAPAPGPAPIPKRDDPPAPPPPSPPKPGPGPKPKDTAWVEIQLVDDAGAPFAASYTIELTDGNTMKGSSSGGKIRMEGIPPGDCQLTFTDIDSSEIAAG